MDRLDEIRSAVPNPKAFEYDSHDTLGLHENWTFIAGARWADRNISDDNINKFFKLYNDWFVAYEEGKTTDKGTEYIKNHWNDEEKNPE